MAKKKPLNGHKRVGSRFIPPMMQIGPWLEVSYVNDILPELVWVGLINDTLGYANGMKLFRNIVASALEANSNVPKNNYAILSSIGELQTVERNRFVESLDSKGVLDQFRNLISPLILLYDQCPVKFVGPPTGLRTTEELVQLVSATVERHFDKYDTPGIVLCRAVLLGRLIAGTYHHMTGTEPPDLNAIVDDPESERAARAASYVRNTALQEFGMKKGSATWARAFWNSNYHLSSCVLERPSNE